MSKVPWVFISFLVLEISVVWDTFSGLFKFCLPLCKQCSPDRLGLIPLNGSFNFSQTPEMAGCAADNTPELIGSRTAGSTEDETSVIRGRGDVRHSLVTKSFTNEDELDQTLSGTVRAGAGLTEPQRGSLTPSCRGREGAGFGWVLLLMWFLSCRC